MRFRNLFRSASDLPGSPEPEEVEYQDPKVLGDDANETGSIESLGSGDSMQAGVRQLELITSSWSRQALWITYIGVCLLTYTTSLAQSTVGTYEPYVTSDFNKHSLISAVTVTSSVLTAVVKPPMAKIGDTFGRTTAFVISTLFYTIGLIMISTSHNASTYVGSQIFYVAGQTGLQVLISIFIADTSTVLNRVFLASLPDWGFLVNAWVGPLIAGNILDTVPGWRIGYGMFAILIPLTAAPLILTLWLQSRRLRKEDRDPVLPWKSDGLVLTMKKLVSELDLVGIIFLSAGLALLLIPLTIASSQPGSWQSPHIIAMIVLGGVCCGVLAIWEIRLARHPIIPFRLFRDRTVVGGVLSGFFYFMAYFLWYNYFTSWLQVARFLSPSSAGYIANSWGLASTLAAIAVGVLIKYTKTYKIWMVIGVPIYTLGIGLMIRFRQPDASIGAIVSVQVVSGIGGGIYNPAALLGIQAAVRHTDVGTATAMYLTFTAIGSAVGGAIAGAIWTNTLPGKLQDYLPPSTRDQVQEIFNDFTKAMAYPQGSPERDAIVRAYSETQRYLLIAGTAFGIPMIFFVLLMRSLNLEAIEKREVETRGMIFGAGSGLGTGAEAGEDALRKDGGDGDGDGRADEEADGGAPVYRLST